ncbi:hypothetical protein BD324DRAFT_649321 [Kockovaella imperatae]|uniref:RNA polymerase II-associated protein 1 C-terminal domain-containing protein n=1 Tax=Kockovaella imperatae TaxID=4999 RepID=A0A1Y1UNX0_9TREE|nr:hypothetical protein BD324DRAFT_649321 [Kockovaella imperatae]ORX39237.1 hypothetical protein BD324DRAFT_649321 [Kockovaella imperatae]
MIVRGIVERPSGSAPPAPPSLPKTSVTGFPQARHRSLASSKTDALARHGENDSSTRASSRLYEPATALDYTSIPSSGLDPAASDVTRREIEAENEARIQAMTAEEREQEAQELIERFGPGLVDIMRRRRDERQAATASTLESRPTPMTRSQTESSAPHGSGSLDRLAEIRAELPGVSVESHKLAWLQDPSPSDDKSIRFDLSGGVLTSEELQSLPTSHGLHHHGDSPELAGYTIQNILTLCRSSILGQRTKMLHLLGTIISRWKRCEEEAMTKTFTDAQVVQKAVDMAVEIVGNTPRAIGLTVAGIDLLCHCQMDNTSLDMDTRPTAQPVIAWELVLPGAQRLLAEDSGIPQASLDRLMNCLQFAAMQSSETAELICTILPEVVRYQVLARPWPINPKYPPSTQAIALVTGLIESARNCAVSIAQTDLPVSVLRFLIPSTWPDDSAPIICKEALQLLFSLARYGLGAEVVRTSMEIFDTLGMATRADPEASAIYFKLLAAWLTCAIDPHRTTPEHSLTWAQVSSMGWVDAALKYIGDSGPWTSSALEAALELIISWILGLAVNSPDKGVVEKRALAQTLRNLTLPIETEPILSRLVQLDLLLTVSDIDGILHPQRRQDLISRLDSTSPVALQYYLLYLGAAHSLIDKDEQASLMLRLFPRFSAGEEHLALDLLDELLKGDVSRSLDGQSHPDLEILRPLLQYAILPSADSVIGPSPPVHTYLKATTSLLRPATPGPGLPLPADWLFSPLGELLRSATSNALAQTPPDWNPSETEIVRAVLFLGQCQVQFGSPSRSQLLFNLMKVFMLENEQHSGTSDGDVFRDDVVSSRISALLLKIITPETSMDRNVNLESVSKAFLGDDTPFYQFYTDYLSLFEAISYSDTSFAQTIMAPLAMSYPTDYRRLLWLDHPPVPRIIHLKISQTPLEHGSFSDYLRPYEKDRDLLNAYAQQLARGWITRERNQLLWTIASSHLSHALWTEQDTNLLKSIGDTSGKTLADLAGVDVQLNGAISTISVNLEKRLDCIRRVCGDNVLAKVKALL